MMSMGTAMGFRTALPSAFCILNHDLSPVLGHSRHKTLKKLCPLCVKSSRLDRAGKLYTMAKCNDRTDMSMYAM